MAQQVRLARAGSARARLGRDPLLARWVEHWFTTLGISETTRVNYECYLRVHILPRFGRVPLSMICRSEIKSWALGLRERYAPATVTSIVTVLSALLADAARDGLIPLNPCRHLRLGPRSTRPQPIATPAQIARIAARLPPTEALLVITAAYTGMRWGELAGLHRRNTVLTPLDYSLAAGVAHVRVDAQEGALHEVGGRLTIGTPKTDSSARVVALPPFLAQLISEHLESHPHPYVFAGRDGGLLRRGAFRTRHWLLALAGDPDHQDPDQREPVCVGMTFHRLRHTHKTWMIEDGIPEIAQYARLGHHMPGIAARYAHATPAMSTQLLTALQHRWESTVASS